MVQTLCDDDSAVLCILMLVKMTLVLIQGCEQENICAKCFMMFAMDLDDGTWYAVGTSSSDEHDFHFILLE